MWEGALSPSRVHLQLAPINSALTNFVSHPGGALALTKPPGYAHELRKYLLVTYWQNIVVIH